MKPPTRIIGRIHAPTRPGAPKRDLAARATNHHYLNPHTLNLEGWVSLVFLSVGGRDGAGCVAPAWKVGLGHHCGACWDSHSGAWFRLGPRVSGLVCMWRLHRRWWSGLGFGCNYSPVMGAGGRLQVRGLCVPEDVPEYVPEDVPEDSPEDSGERPLQPVHVHLWASFNLEASYSFVMYTCSYCTCHSADPSPLL